MDEISRVDPLDVDLDLADRLAAVDAASHAHAGLEIRPPNGPGRLTYLQHGNEGRPVDGLWVARSDGAEVGWVLADLPWRGQPGDGRRARGVVHPEVRRRGIGGRLLDEAVGFAAGQGRGAIHSGAFVGTDGGGFLERRGFSTEGQHVYAIRRLDLHSGRWIGCTTRRRLWRRTTSWSTSSVPLRTHCSTAWSACTRRSTTRPPTRGPEPSVWDADRVRVYDERMTKRRQTTYRVLARHVPTETGLA